MEQSPARKELDKFAASMAALTVALVQERPLRDFEEGAVLYTPSTTAEWLDALGLAAATLLGEWPEWAKEEQVAKMCCCASCASEKLHWVVDGICHYCPVHGNRDLKDCPTCGNPVFEPVAPNICPQHGSASAPAAEEECNHRHWERLAVDRGHCLIAGCNLVFPISPSASAASAQGAE